MIPDQNNVLSTVKIRKIKLASNNTCEMCSGVFPQYALVLYVISRKKTAEYAAVSDDACDIIVLCTNCLLKTRRNHTIRRGLNHIVGKRPVLIREKIQQILSSKGGSYESAVQYDLAEIFSGAYNLEEMDLFLNGA
jgi:hypothetical protein